MAPSGPRSGGESRASDRNRNGSSRATSTTTTSTKPKEEPGLEGCVFDYGDNRHADAFITHKKTFEEHLAGLIL